MNPDNVSLENLTKIFEYEKISRELDSVENIEQLRTLCKCYIKLYMKQQEVLCNLS